MPVVFYSPKLLEFGNVMADFSQISLRSEGLGVAGSLMASRKCMIW